jgi:hybrid cluster-associated redox disulfide protein
VKTPLVSEILCIPIAILLDSYPRASQIFIHNRMGCVGCAFARFHTLKDAIEIYQLEEETFLREVWDLLGGRDDLNTSRGLFDEVSSQG